MPLNQSRRQKRTAATSTRPAAAGDRGDHVVDEQRPEPAELATLPTKQQPRRAGKPDAVDSKSEATASPFGRLSIELAEQSLRYHCEACRSLLHISNEELANLLQHLAEEYDF